MKTSIFIRSYFKDIEWLKWLLKSIELNCEDFHELVLCYPVSQSSFFQEINFIKFPFRKVTCPDYKNDYMGQQISKLYSYKWCEGDIIMFLDSDCICNSKFGIKDHLIDDKIPLYKTPYSLVGDAICWKDITEKAVGFEVNYEYMRGFPFIFYRRTLEKIESYLGFNIEEYVLKQPHNAFSEFNLIGSIVEKYESDNYLIIDSTIEHKSPKFVTQRWSHDNLIDKIDDIKKELSL